MASVFLESVIGDQCGGDDGDLAVRLARRRDADLYVMAEGSEKLHQALGGKGTCASAPCARVPLASSTGN